MLTRGIGMFISFMHFSQDISPVIESRSIRVDGLNSTFISDVSYEECSLTDAEGLGKMVGVIYISRHR